MALQTLVNADHGKILIRHLSERCFELTTQETIRQKLSIRYEKEIAGLDPCDANYQLQKDALTKKFERKNKSLHLIRQNRWLLLMHRHKQELEQNGLPLTRALETLPPWQTHSILGS
jgi:hypothetical protein